MKLRIDEITDEEREVRLAVPVGRLVEDLGDDDRLEFRPSKELAARLGVYRAGEDIVVGGEVKGAFSGECCRCLGPVSVDVVKQFHTILLPEAENEPDAPELSAEDLALGFFSGDELELAPICLEQVLVELPTRALCGPECRGLCSSCGSNLNEETCSCSAEVRDPRLAVLRNLKVGRR